jgi:hypothetical protein
MADPGLGLVLAWVGVVLISDFGVGDDAFLPVGWISCSWLCYFLGLSSLQEEYCLSRHMPGICLFEQRPPTMVAWPPSIVISIGFFQGSVLIPKIYI